MIKFYFEMKNDFLAPSSKEFNNSPLTINWLGGFTDGVASFSISNFKPRLKFENHVKELELFNRIKDLLNINNNLIISKPRFDRPNSNATVNLDITDILHLKNVIIPLYSTIASSYDTNLVIEKSLLKTKKFKDFRDWSFVVLAYYYGYHLIDEGQIFITEIKNSWNNFRLTTHYLNNKENTAINFETKFKILLLIPSPYEIKNGIRFIRNTNKLVSEGLKIIAIDNFNNESIFLSITECSLALKLDRAKIKHCLITGETYKNYKFKFASN